MNIIIDSDGFFWPDSIGNEYMREQREHISIDREPQPIETLIEQYYLGFRSALFICEDSIEDESEALDLLRTYREECVHSAMSYARKHITSEQSLPVDFLWIAREAIIHAFKNEYPEIENINLRLSMKPRLSARTVGKNTIIFPALSRTVINHCNLVIINSFFRAVNDNGQLVGDIDRSQTARFIFPYLLFCHDDFSVANLPIIGVYSQNALVIAAQFTNLQMIFILAHEYAHILLQHYDKIEASSSRKEDMENEADELALKMVLSYVEKSGGAYSKFDVFTAIRWLFKYQLIDDSMGSLIQGKPLDIPNSKTEERRGRFQSDLINNYGLRSTNLLDGVGFYIIFELQGILYEYGPDLISSIINTFHEIRKTGKIEPWWEQIKRNEYASGKIRNIIDSYNNHAQEE